VPYSSDATRTYRQFLKEGANMIFDTSSTGDFLHEVVKRAPEVAFMECDGHTIMDNLSWYYLAHWYPTYVIGVAAGLLSETGKLGYVASFPVASVFCSTNAFIMGARSVNPDATLQTIVINSWFDPQAATQAGTALVDNGCDFLFGIMDEAGYLQVAEKRGVWAAMWNTDIRRYGPNAYVSSVIIDFNDFYVDQVGKRLAGTWTSGEHILPLGGGVDRSDRARAGIEVLDREARRVGRGDQRRGLGNAGGVDAEAVLAVDVEGQPDGRSHLDDMHQQLVTRHVLIETAPRSSVPRARGRECGRADLGEQFRRGDVPRIRHHQDLARVQLAEPITELTRSR